MEFDSGEVDLPMKRSAPKPVPDPFDLLRETEVPYFLRDIDLTMPIGPFRKFFKKERDSAPQVIEKAPVLNPKAKSDDIEQYDYFAQDGDVSRWRKGPGSSKKVDKSKWIRQVDMRRSATSESHLEDNASTGAGRREQRRGQPHSKR
jgi:hypothetical protein